MHFDNFVSPCAPVPVLLVYLGIDVELGQEGLYITLVLDGKKASRKISKRVLIVHPENLEARKVFGTRHGFRVCTGVYNIRGYIGNDEYKKYCLRERVR